MSKSERRIQRFEQLSPFVMLAGFALVGCAATQPNRAGGITGFMAILAGACAGTLQGDCRASRSRLVGAASSCRSPASCG